MAASGFFALAPGCAWAPSALAVIARAQWKARNSPTLCSRRACRDVLFRTPAGARSLASNQTSRTDKSSSSSDNNNKTGQQEPSGSDEDRADDGLKTDPNPGTAPPPPPPPRPELEPIILNPFDTGWKNTKASSSAAAYSDLPHRLFGYNQHMIINSELTDALRLMLRQFTAPIVYCFAYGSGVFAQSDGRSSDRGEQDGPDGRSITEAEFRAVHPRPPEALVKAQRGKPKMIDFIFGVTHSQHWHSINMRQHRDHYSAVATLGSAAATYVQERWGAGVYFHPYITVDGMLIKYGVTSIDNLVQDLSTWDNLYLAGRLHKPVKILRDHPRVRLAHQHNLIAAVRTALLVLPETFSELDLYRAITAISYLGDPRMSLPTESRTKVADIVTRNVGHFRRMYGPLIGTLPNLSFVDPARFDSEGWIMDPQANHRLVQDMDPVKRGNMVRRLPSAFRSRLYFRYRKKLGLPRDEFDAMMEASNDEDPTGSVNKRQGSEFDRRIASDEPLELKRVVRTVIRQTVKWPATTQSLKGPLTAGFTRSARYLAEKFAKWRGA